MKIDIGGGTLLARGYINLDPTHGSGAWKRMAQDTPWPTGDNTVDAVRASHVMEHIPSGQDRITVMNEVWRVLKPGHDFTIIVPIVMANNKFHNGWQAWADPTHVSYWVYPESFQYFCEGPFKAHADYGIKYWKALNTARCEVKSGFEANVVLTKP